MSRSLAEKLLTLRSIVLPNLHIEILPYVEYHLVIYDILLECIYQVLLRSGRKFMAQSGRIYLLSITVKHQKQTSLGEDMIKFTVAVVAICVNINTA